MRARKIGRWVGCAVIAGVLTVGTLVGVTAANADVIWERARPSTPSDKAPARPAVWVPAAPGSAPSAVDTAPASAD